MYGECIWYTGKGFTVSIVYVVFVIFDRAGTVIADLSSTVYLVLPHPKSSML